MREKVKFYGSIFILIFLVPYLITLYVNGGAGIFTRTGKDEQLEQQVLSVLAAEIPADYDLECLKAQAVITRTNLCNGSLEGWPQSQMQDVWGDSYQENYRKMEMAVTETAGQILVYKGEPIVAAFHRACNGKTRDASQVPGQEAYEYLQSVESKEDILADGFLTIRYMEKEELKEKLQELFSDESLDAELIVENLKIIERDCAAYVTRVQFGSTIVSGEAVREVLGLNSACFYLSEVEGKVRILTKGIGHGLGFSQFGACQRAKEGWKYQELLDYYYQGIEVEEKN